MHVHLVFVTKYRRDVFTKIILDDMQNIFSKVCNSFEDASSHILRNKYHEQIKTKLCGNVYGRHLTLPLAVAVLQLT